jgi:hypothetical protein
MPPPRFRFSKALVAICCQEDRRSWSKLPDDAPFSQLSSKYWGNNIECEAKRWRKSHPTIVDDPANDIGPDCFMLNLDINFSPSKLWVRQDYIRIYDYCKKRHASGPLTTGRQRSVVLTGQPGVGEFLSSAADVFSNNCFLKRQDILADLRHPSSSR